MWNIDSNGQTATAEPVPITADGQLVAVLQPLWSDEDGVMTDLVWHAAADALTAAQARALGIALQQLADAEPPTRAC